MGRKKRGKSAKRARASQAQHEEAEPLVKAPHSFVFHRGNVGDSVLQLVQDLRKVMEPFTASKLKAQQRNNLRDFISIAGPLGVSHFLMLTRTEVAVNLRIVRVPRGPTLTFRVTEYCLSRDVVSSLRKPFIHQTQLLHAPLLVMNNFSGDQNAQKLMQTMFQNMFPTVNVNKVKLDEIRRCVLLNYNGEKDVVEFRHYAIKAVPSGVSRSTKKLMQSKIPKLGNYKDVSDYFLNPDQLSESEYEGDGGNEVELAQDLKTRGCKASQLCAIRLVEIGPRLTLKLLKVEEGICDGEVLHHSYITKTAEQIETIRGARFKKRTLKERRRLEQEANVQKKLEQREEHRNQCLDGMKQRGHMSTKMEEKLKRKAETAAEDGHVLRKKRKVA